jgi:hypothetical protein
MPHIYYHTDLKKMALTIGMVVCPVDSSSSGAPGPRDAIPDKDEDEGGYSILDRNGSAETESDVSSEGSQMLFNNDRHV